MPLTFAYLGVVIIWSTTPLAVQWSGNGVGPMFGVSARMLISALLCVLIMKALRIPLNWDKNSRSVYLIVGVSLYVAMSAIYWAAQLIPSGWISVVFGLSPMFTGIFARFGLGERLGIFMLLGMLLGILGLASIFNASDRLLQADPLGILLVLVASLFHSGSAVWIKKLGIGLHPLASTTGGLWVALPMYLLTWFILDGTWPSHITSQTAWATIYLGIVGSVIGFSLYFYLLKHISASKLALVTLITPVTALAVGHFINDEPFNRKILLGCGLILLGLLCYQWGERVFSGLMQLRDTHGITYLEQDTESTQDYSQTEWDTKGHKKGDELI